MCRPVSNIGLKWQLEDNLADAAMKYVREFDCATQPETVAVAANNLYEAALALRGYYERFSGSTNSSQHGA